MTTGNSAGECVMPCVFDFRFIRTDLNDVNILMKMLNEKKNATVQNEEEKNQNQENTMRIRHRTGSMSEQRISNSEKTFDSDTNNQSSG